MAALAFLKQRLGQHPTERNNLYPLIQLVAQENRRELIEPYLPRLSQLALADRQASELVAWLKASR